MRVVFEEQIVTPAPTSRARTAQCGKIALGASRTQSPAPTIPMRVVALKGSTLTKRLSSASLATIAVRIVRIPTSLTATSAMTASSFRQQATSVPQLAQREQTRTMPQTHATAPPSESYVHFWTYSEAIRGLSMMKLRLGSRRARVVHRNTTSAEFGLTDRMTI
jgi:predicted component of type VI protein secretion system